MKHPGFRSGSALLIVLGMTAFILVSAIAFSAYMRHARMPSSYLRRSSASRMLAKAALAEAIETVDASIGNNPYPGVGASPSRLPRAKESTGSSWNRNIWEQRVFIGTNVNDAVSTENTVSTLTLEGLAYIPPPFVNEVRYWSRHALSAGWQTMSFDAGRYAFCAVDVSDCFDVNRLMADIGRDSSDANRITLSHCFENPSHTGYTVQPSVWDDFMDGYLDSGKVPLVSVADLNLAINFDNPGGIESPFCKYLQQTGNAKFVTDDSDSANAELMRNMAFVTDSWFPATNATDASVIDLARESDQPFSGMKCRQASDLTKNADTFDQMVERTNAKFRNQLSVPEVAALYDYLDRDSIPLSLALPTVERVPMVTGVALNGSVSVIVEPFEQEVGVGEPNDKNEYAAYVKVSAGALSLAGELGAKVSVVYPFKYDRGTTPAFKAQLAATVTLVPEGSEKLLRRSSAKSPFAIGRDDWTTSKKAPVGVKVDGSDFPVVVTMQSAPQAISLKTVTTEEDAVLADLTFNLGSFNMSMVPGTQLKDDPLMSGLSFDEKCKKTSFRKIVKRDADNKVLATVPLHTALKFPKGDLNGLEDPSSGAKCVPVVQAWVRILDANDKVVDLVPAYYKDDAAVSSRLTDIRSAAVLPLVRFFNEKAEDVELVYDDTVFAFGGGGGNAKVMTPYPLAYFADDPRFNYAPENLKAVATLTGDFKDEWYANVQRSKGRDGDIFMATSDAGYLQSMYELSFINDMDLAMVNAATYNGTMRVSFENTPANEAMWRTYSQIKLGDSTGGDITDIFRFVDGGRGFRVNPFTSDVNIMMAALANTPLDWWAASTNDIADVTKQKMLDGREEAQKYTFSQLPGAKVQVEHGSRNDSADTLMGLAQEMMSAFRSRNDGDWQTAFDNLNWKTENEIAGVDLGVDLHSVDKKYLHGFWRGCFANRQHLFLIFVRAEPMMMGGGGVNQTPPQLGARAVALVWRDPTHTDNGVDGQPRPHRTRVLFYRQFD